MRYPFAGFSADLPASAEAAIRIQKELREQVRLENDFPSFETVAGIDCSYDLQTGMSRAVIAVMRLDTLDLKISVMAHQETVFPYIPGLLSFREIPVILDALALLPEKPDLLMVDGQGIAHPRRLGIAAHLGVLLDVPALGVAKSRLCGQYQEPGAEKGAASELTDKGEHLGWVLRSKDNCLPLFVSPGHRIDHRTALKIVRNSLTRYRLPEPTRVADHFSKIRPGAKRQAQLNPPV